MRVWRAIFPSLSGLGAGYLLCVASMLWLRATVEGTELLWNVVSPFRLGAWLLTTAHGVPVVVRSVAGVQAPEAAGSVGGLSELLGGSSDLVFSFSLLLIPLTVLAAVGVATALVVRRLGPQTMRDLAVLVAVCSAVHAVVLGSLSALAGVEFVFEGSLAPELGLGAATGRVALGLGHPVVVAVVVGLVWGAAFATAGGLASPSLRSSLDAPSRILLRGWIRGLGLAAAAFAVAMALGGLVMVVLGRAPSPGLVGLGGLLLGGNAVATAILLAHGASMSVALDAGPFTGWERMDLLNVGAGGGGHPALWLVLVVPIAVGVAVGRFVGRRTDLGPIAVALRFGTLWGLTLAVLALLLRVRVLSSFSVGSLDLGGGSATFDPLIALLVGAVWGAVTSYAGAVSVGPRARPWTCPECSITNAPTDAFCVSCGARRPTSVPIRARGRAPHS